jgi:ABC-type multidrug transport system ATPase subunit
MGDTTGNKNHTLVDGHKPSTELHLRWARVQKVVELKDDARKSLKGRISKITPDTTQHKVILNKVSGEAKPGEIIALMGPSGSGKTSLMNVLSGRATYQDGTISINGNLLEKDGMKRFMSKVAYVKQHDVFFEELTVRDQLTYTAQFRIPDTNIDKKVRQEHIRTEVNRIIKLLRLTKVADSQIFMCSGGEKKRVNIGTELITDPSVIMLDEPTSGLDSASAVSLLKVLKDLANQGKTIITSIHQPNSESFLNFDKLLMLSDGNVVFFGKPSESLAYLRTQGHACPAGYNLADHWMNLLVTDSSVEEERNEDPKRSGHGISPRFQLQTAWDNDKVATTMAVVEELQHNRPRKSRTSVAEIFATDENASKYTTSWWTQFSTLTHRALKKSKSTVFSPINIIKTIAVGVIVGLVFLNQQYTERDIFNIYAYFFFTMVFWVMSGMFEALFAFPQERVIILKERATASYRLSAYFASCTVADLPVFLCMPCIYMVISYWMIVPTLGFTKFLIITGISFLAVMTGQALGFLIGAGFDDIKIAQAFATVVVLFLMLLGGFFARNIPLWLSWVGYLSPFKYASNAALLVIFDAPVPCDGSGALSPLCAVDDTTTMVSAHAVLTSPNMNVELSIGVNILLLLVFCIVPRLFTYTILRRKKGGERE